MTIKDALFREFKFGLCGPGGALDGLVAQDHIKLDTRGTPSQTRAESDYPWIIFRRITNTENNQVRYSRERIEVEIIGLLSSATKGDDLLETIQTAIRDHFSGLSDRWGAYNEDGTPDPDGGLPMKGIYLSTIEDFTEDPHEKAQVMIFLFAFLRRQE